MPHRQSVRQRTILETLDADGSVGVEELAERFRVSNMTIRRDLSNLEQDGFLVRTHGGAVKSRAVDAMFSFERRLHRNRRRKERICEAAAGFLRPGSVIFIDCGTTLFRLSKHVRGVENLRIVTNSLPIVSQLSTETSARITLTGGDLVFDRKALYGRIAEDTLKAMHADVAFIGADGVSVSGGLTSFDEMEGGISASMAESADRVILLCDSSKIGHTSYYKFGALSLADVLVTDSSEPADELDACGFEVIRT